MSDGPQRERHGKEDPQRRTAGQSQGRGRTMISGPQTSAVHVGDHMIEVMRYGHGDPTVVIVPGFGATAEEWQRVAMLVAPTTSVLVYDRPPYGSSGPAADRRTAGDIAAELATLLDSIGVTGPVVLVGHSAGGRYVRRFATDHPDRVAGMVLVDSSHEDQQRRLTASLSRRMRWLERLTPFLLMADRTRSLAVRRTMVREYRALARQTSADLIPEGALGTKPLVVLTRARGSDPMLSSGWQVWYELQAELARRSHNHRHAIAETEGHFIHVDDPQLVVHTILDVVRAARTGTQLD